MTKISVILYSRCELYKGGAIFMWVEKQKYLYLQYFNQSYYMTYTDWQEMDFTYYVDHVWRFLQCGLLTFNLKNRMVSCSLPVAEFS